MHIAVYAICKNEAKFAARWMDSMREADSVTVLDTGSEDGTAALLRSLGAAVSTERIEPWRFDTARNRSLSLVPEAADICVCTDLDEVLLPGWRAALEKAWTPGTGSARYRLAWGGGAGYTYYVEKAHTRHGWQWTHPVHEVLEWVGPGDRGGCVTSEGMELRHWPDAEKSRAQYLPLLELAVREAPEDDRNRHYLGREYMYAGRWEDCIRTLREHLSMPTAVWRDERCASMRFIARSYAALGQREEARCWYLRAIAEAPHLREGYTDMARLLYELGEWDGVLHFTALALRITERPLEYICEAESWGALPWDLRAVALYRRGRFAEALAAAETALSFAPEDERLRRNVQYCREQQ